MNTVLEQFVEQQQHQVLMRGLTEGVVKEVIHVLVAEGLSHHEFVEDRGLIRLVKLNTM